MNNKKWIGTTLFWITTGALMIYAASRSVHFINSTLSADNQAVGWLALFASSFGALAWLAVYLYSSKGATQKTICQVLIVADVAAEILLFSVDTITGASSNGLVIGLTPDDIQTILYCMSALIGLNIAGAFYFKINDQDNLAQVEIDQAEASIAKAIRKAKVAKAQELSAGIAERAAEQYGQELTPDAPVPVFSSLFGDKQSPKAKGGTK